MMTKKRVFIGLCVVIVIAAGCAQSAGAQLAEEQAEEAGFVFDPGDGSVCAYTGSEKVIAFPFRIGGRPVTAVGEGAFHNKGLTGVTIPDSVTAIGDFVVADNELTSVTICQCRYTGIIILPFAIRALYDGRQKSSRVYF
jgi:hypothetical protein